MVDTGRMVEETLREHFDRYLGKTEIAIYSTLSLLLTITVLAGIASASKLLWDALAHWSIATQTLRVLNELLIVLMLVEILHTVRISIRSHVLVTEPFLVVGLIASIRRVLVISLEMATLSKEGSWPQQGNNINCDPHRGRSVHPRNYSGCRPGSHRSGVKAETKTHEDDEDSRRRSDHRASSALTRRRQARERFRLDVPEHDRRGAGFGQPRRSRDQTGFQGKWDEVEGLARVSSRSSYEPS
jgi:uncharacterized membrane protein (DUF373 family)